MAPHRTGQTNAKWVFKSFNGSFRDACLNGILFSSLAQVRSEIKAWKDDCNKSRSHSSFGNAASNEFIIKSALEKRVVKANVNIQHSAEKWRSVGA